MRNIVITLQFGRRIVLYPEGGMDLQRSVDGIGWVNDNAAANADELCREMVSGALSVVRNAADRS